MFTVLTVVLNIRQRGTVQYSTVQYSTVHMEDSCHSTGHFPGQKLSRQISMGQIRYVCAGALLKYSCTCPASGCEHISITATLGCPSLLLSAVLCTVDTLSRDCSLKNCVSTDLGAFLSSHFFLIPNATH